MLYCGTSSISAEFLPNKDVVYLNAVKAIGLQNSKTYLHAAFAQEGNRICIKSKQYPIVFLVLFSLLWVILRHKLVKCRIFTKQLRRSVFKCLEGYRITKLKDLSSRSFCARRKPNLYKK